MDGGGLTVLIVDVCGHIVLSWDRFQPPPKDKWDGWV